MNHTMRSSGKHRLTDNIEEEDKSNDASVVVTKRLRGGGNEEEEDDDDDNNNNNDEEYEEELYDVDAMPDEDEYMEEPEPHDEPNDSNGKPTPPIMNMMGLSASQVQRWKRTAIPSSLNPQQQSSSSASFHPDQDLHLQWLDIDLISGSPLSTNPNPTKRHVIGGSTGEVPIIRIYGVTENGHSAVAFLHGYTPYGYFALPEGYEMTNYASASPEEKDRMLGQIRDVLNTRMKNAKSQNRKIDTDIVRGVQYVQDHKSIMGYSTSHTRFLKVFVSLPNYVPALKRVMEEGVSLPGIGPCSGQEERGNLWDDGGGGGGKVYQPFECNVPFVLRFMIDRDICGAGWLTLPKGTYVLRKDDTTNCQVCMIYMVLCALIHAILDPCRSYFFRRITHSLAHSLTHSLTSCNNHNSWKQTYPTMISKHTNPKENGTKSHPFESYPWILNARAARATSPKPKKIPSSKSPTPSRSTVTPNPSSKQSSLSIPVSQSSVHRSLAVTPKRKCCSNGESFWKRPIRILSRGTMCRISIYRTYSIGPMRCRKWTNRFGISSRISRGGEGSAGSMPK